MDTDMIALNKLYLSLYLASAQKVFLSQVTNDSTVDDSLVL